MNMKQWKAYRAVQKIVKREGVSEQCIIQSIEEAIAEAYANSVARNDVDAIARWAAIPCENGLPTAIELIAYLGEQVEKTCEGSCS